MGQATQFACSAAICQFHSSFGVHTRLYTYCWQLLCSMPQSCHFPAPCNCCCPSNQNLVLTFLQTCSVYGRRLLVASYSNQWATYLVTDIHTNWTVTCLQASTRTERRGVTSARGMVVLASTESILEVVVTLVASTTTASTWTSTTLVTLERWVHSRQQAHDYWAASVNCQVLLAEHQPLYTHSLVQTSGSL